jgi:hypothetical protein
MGVNLYTATLRRKIEGALMPQYLSFVASLRESAAAAAAAAHDARENAQANVVGLQVESS